MSFTVDPAALAGRFFSSRALYSSVDWTKLDAIVEAYNQRLIDWYVTPSRTLATDIHAAFTVMALNCLLIDTLSQFVAGQTSSSRSTFMDFVRSRLPSQYSATINGGVPRHTKGMLDPITTVDQVLYFGFRCGILHEAHIPPYCGVIPDGPAITVVPPDGSVMHTPSSLSSPRVIANPLALRDDVEGALVTYVGQLKSRTAVYDQLRANFKNKFTSAFGIDIGSAV